MHAVRYLRNSLSENPVLGWIVLLFVVVNCASIVAVEHDAGVLSRGVWSAIGVTALCLALVPLFVLAPFSFGFLVSVCFYGMITGYVWVSYFSLSAYDHERARLSAIASLIAFLLPALFLRPRVRRLVSVSAKQMDGLLLCLLGLGIVLLAWNASYGFALVGIHQAEQIRATFVRPILLNYMTGSLIGGVLPFAFAYFAVQGRHTLAIASIVVLLLFYPVLLTKTVLFSAIWLPFLFFLFALFEPRRAAVLSLLVPTTIGLAIYTLVGKDGVWSQFFWSIFGSVNVRMMAIPSIAMDYYYDFFSRNPLTHFCQVGAVRAIFGCSYTEPLWVLLNNVYGVGNLNASLFATEGVASVGLAWAPLSALVCGSLLSVGNGLSRNLPPPLVATSAGLVVQALLNVPLSISLLSNGLFALFLLWYIAPGPYPDARSV